MFHRKRWPSFRQYIRLSSVMLLLCFVQKQATQSPKKLLIFILQWVQPQDLLTFLTLDDVTSSFPLPYLSTVTEKLALSSSFIDNTGLRILSSWCTNLYTLILQRCQHLDIDELGCFSTGFSSLLCVDLSNNTFIDKTTKEKLLNCNLTKIFLVGWQISPEDEFEIMEKFLRPLLFKYIYAKNGESILEIEEY